jgi:hypothetical protein
MLGCKIWSARFSVISVPKGAASPLASIRPGGAVLLALAREGRTAVLSKVNRAAIREWLAVLSDTTNQEP